MSVLVVVVVVGSLGYRGSGVVRTFESEELEFSMAEAAKELGVSKESVRRWIQDGKIQAVMKRKGHLPAWYIPKHEVERKKEELLKTKIVRVASEERTDLVRVEDIETAVKEVVVGVVGSVVSDVVKREVGERIIDLVELQKDFYENLQAEISSLREELSALREQQEKKKWWQFWK